MSNLQTQLKTMTQEQSNDDYKNEFVFSYNPTVLIPCIEMTVFGYQTSKEFRQQTEVLLKHVVAQHRTMRALADTTYMELKMIKNGCYMNLFHVLHVQ
jgi:hypothetical protein